MVAPAACPGLLGQVLEEVVNVFIEQFYEFYYNCTIDV